MLIIEILNGNFKSEKSAYKFGEMLKEELSEIKLSIIHHPYTTDSSNGVRFYGNEEDDEEQIESAIQDTFSRSDMWEED